MQSKVTMNNNEIMTNKGPGIFMQYVRCELNQCFVQDNSGFAIELEDEPCQNLLNIVNEDNQIGLSKKRYITGDIGGNWGKVDLSHI